MPDLENPYASPQAEIVAENKLINQNALTDLMLKHLKDASPWLRFIGILSYIGCGFLALTGIITMTAMGALTSAWESLANLDFLNGLFTTAFSISMGITYIIIAVICFFPAHFTYNFGSKLRDYFLNGRDQELEIAFKNNKSLWKFYGIVMIIYLAFIPVLIVISIVAVVASALI